MSDYIKENQEEEWEQQQKRKERERERIRELVEGQSKKKEIDSDKIVERERMRAVVSTELALKTKDLNLFGNKDELVLSQVKTWIRQIIRESGTFLSMGEQDEILREIILEITSLGKLHNLMEEASISEIMVNATDEIWIEKKGKLTHTDIKFRDELEVLDLARKIAGHVGRRIDNSNPIVDARLPDGSRVHIVIPPIAMKGTTITIRKFFQEKLGIENLINFGTISELGARFLEGAVQARSNIVISGGTGSGKTTTLNILSNFVPNDERIITIEDSAELQLNNDHVVKLESRPANAEGTGEVNIQDLIKASLRMRPERVIVGEVRDGSALDLLQAMNTGHDGSMGTVHSNSPTECIARLATLVLYAGYEIPDQAIKEQIAGSVDLVVQISRLKDGTRKITHISEVVGYDLKEEKMIIHDLFVWRMTGIVDGKLEGSFEFTGTRPTDPLLEKFERHNVQFDKLMNEGRE